MFPVREEGAALVGGPMNAEDLARRIDAELLAGSEASVRYAMEHRKAKDGLLDNSGGLTALVPYANLLLQMREALKDLREWSQGEYHNNPRIDTAADEALSAASRLLGTE
jgi:hypothetical protein